MLSDGYDACDELDGSSGGCKLVVGCLFDQQRLAREECHVRDRVEERSSERDTSAVLVRAAPWDPP